MTVLSRGYRSSLLRRNADFRAVWAGEALSRAGTQITAVALPLVAVKTLDAAPGQLGLLTALQFVPVLLVTPLAGAFADRLSRRQIMMVANLGRAITLAVVPTLAVADRLTMHHLYLVAAVTGGLTAAFDVVYLAYIPHLVRRENLIEANGLLQTTYSAAHAAGPGVGGLLVQALTAPIAVLVDALSYLAAFASLLLVRRIEPVMRPAPRPSGQRSWVGVGLRTLFADRRLRLIVIQAAWFNLFEQMVLTLFFLYGVRQLHLADGLLGLCLTCGGVGSVLGAAAASRLGSRYGIGAVLAGGMALASFPLAAVPAAVLVGAWAAVVLAAALLISGAGLTAFNVHAVTFRQLTTAPALLGRVTASYRLISFGTIPLGGVLAGVLGERLGVMQALIAAAGGLTVGGIAFVIAVPIVCGRMTLQAVDPAAPEAKSNKDVP